jgi:hypothetical protein
MIVTTPTHATILLSLPLALDPLLSYPQMAQSTQIEEFICHKFSYVDTWFGEPKPRKMLERTQTKLGCFSWPKGS